jgi:UDP-N-acetylmuramoyl-L-alanyl-D-glutamate--2,6-diaminopimelate ligase
MLSELVDLLGTPILPTPSRFHGVTHDSRKVTPGDIYVALRGANFDGHDFIANAMSMGAAAVIVEQSRQALLLAGNIPGWSVQDPRQVMGYVADIVYNHPTHHMHVVGVTGTNGKTSTTHIIAHLAKGLFQQTGIIGTLGAFASGVSVPGQRTTPEAPDLQSMLSAMQSHSVDVVAMEVASHALVHGRVNGCLFDAAVFTNLTQDHLDFHGSMESYFEAKASLFTTHFDAASQGGKQPFAVIGIDTEWGNRLCTMMRDFPFTTYSVNAGAAADLVAVNIRLSASSTDFDLLFDNQSFPVVLPLGGAFQIQNALAALGCFIGAGGSVADGVALLRTCPQIPGRFEIVTSKQSFAVVVDYAHTPDGLENVLSTARELCSGKLICVFGCGGDRDRSKRPLMGAIAEKYSDEVIVTSDNPRSEDAEAIIDQIIAGMSINCVVRRESDRRLAIAQAVTSRGADDVVVIAGKGHETYQIVHDQVIPFDDRLIASEELSKCS